MKKYDDSLEKVLTAIFGVVGTSAIIISLFIHGWTTDNILAGLVDLAGLVVVIAVFLIANKLFIRDRKFDFTKRFEHHLKVPRALDPPALFSMLTDCPTSMPQPANCFHRDSPLRDHNHY